MTPRVTLAAVGLVVLGLAPAAAAKQKPITGSAPKGYTVIALADNGRATTAVAKPKFKIAPPAKVVTLHLRDKSGGYAGPLVVGGKGSSVIVGVKAGTDAGKLRTKRGYFLTKVAKRSLEARRTARAKNGVPLGALKLGLVTVPATGKAGPGRDLDLDGLPGAFDVDDDGDLKIDNVDRPATASTHTTQFPDQLHPWWVINAGLEVSFILEDRGATQGAAGYALNVNAAGPFAGDDDFKKLQNTVMKDRGALLFGLPDANAELDCGGLSYCRAGGTGGAHSRTKKYPEQFDADGDGLGSMPPLTAGEITEGQDGLGTFSQFKPEDVFGIAPNAGDGEIASGDTFLRVGSGDARYPLSLNTVFETVPAISGWGSHGTGAQGINYPTLRGGAGSESTPFELTLAAGESDYFVNLNVWRPQRRPISAAEGSGWIDQGGLEYTVVGKTVEQNRRVFACRGADYLPNFDAVVGGERVVDVAPDRPTDPANQVAFFVNISQCLRRELGIEWGPGGIPVDLFVAAHSAYGDVAEGGGFAFKPKGAGASADQFTGVWKFPNGTPGTTVDWTIYANSADTPRFGIIAYPPRAIVSGTTPAGWNCRLGSAGPNPMWECSGNTLHAGESVSGQVTLNQDGQDNMSLDMLICDAQDQCKGFGMTQQK